MLLPYVHQIFRNSGGDAVLSMWDDVDVSATAPHGSLTISASNPTSVAVATNSREQERKTSAPVVTPPIQSKKHFLDGFKMRGNLRPRTKSDDNVSDTPCTATGVLSSTTSTTSDSDRISSRFRNTSTSFDAAAAAADAIGAGSVTKVLVDYRPANDDEVVVDRGDAVQVREVTPQGRYLVVTQSGQEGWVPGYVLNLLTTGPPKKPAATGSWTFKNRFKKQQSSGTLKEDCRPPLPAVDATCTVNCGDTAVLRCRRMTSSPTAVSGERWMAPNGHLLINSGRKYSFGADVDTAVLYITLVVVFFILNLFFFYPQFVFLQGLRCEGRRRIHLRAARQCRVHRHPASEGQGLWGTTLAAGASQGGRPSGDDGHLGLGAGGMLIVRGRVLPHHGSQ